MLRCQNHRIVESFRLEKTFEIIESNRKPHTTESLPLNHVPECYSTADLTVERRLGGLSLLSSVEVSLYLVGGTSPEEQSSLLSQRCLSHHWQKRWLVARPATPLSWAWIRIAYDKSSGCCFAEVSSSRHLPVGSAGFYLEFSQDTFEIFSTGSILETHSPFFQVTWVSALHWQVLRAFQGYPTKYSGANCSDVNYFIYWNIQYRLVVHPVS